MTKYILLGLAVVILGGIAALPFITEAYFYPYPYIDTKFTPSFSWDKYKQIQNGMNAEQVSSLLGEPFMKPSFIQSPSGTCGQQVGGTECWSYTQDGGKYSPWDFAWIEVLVSFDENGKVNGTQQLVAYD